MLHPFLLRLSQRTNPLTPSLLFTIALTMAASSWADHPVTTNPLDTITITGTRDQGRLADTAASVGIIDQQTLQDINPTHAADLLNRIPGVNIVQLGSSGQGVSAAIRQPISTGPVYLYLENGVPTRSPAFFNHNALYEVNVAQANGVEVIKGPGSALYGSDAIGGVINVISDRPITDNRLGLSMELGEHEWQRVQVDGSRIIGQHHLALRLDTMDSAGWREHTGFDRQSANIIWQTRAADFDINTVYTATRLDMDTGGSGLSEEDFRNHPTRAGNLIGYRDVSARRLSSAFKRELANGSLTLTPYLRRNRLEYMATWTLNTGREVYVPWRDEWALDSQDAHINDSGDDSLGLLIKYQRPLSGLQNAFWITGVDLDYSQGYTRQTYIERTDQDSGRYWLSYRRDRLIYDYEVDFSSISPYLHLEADLSERWRINAGLRYDRIKYDYSNHLGTDLTNPVHKRPADTHINLNHLSPKLGLIYRMGERLNAFASLRQGFRIPSESQLFRAGSNQDSTELSPVTADSAEVGLRGQIFERVDFDITVYRMTKEDEIINVTDETGARRNVNAGETSHQGIEVGADLPLTQDLQLGISWTHSQHRFEDWRDGATIYNGNSMPDAPRSFANVRLHYAPYWLNGGRMEAEWIHQGQHFLNESNQLSYPGHQLLNLRASYQLDQGWLVYINIYNAEDRRYAETTGKWGPVYTPGRPRSAFAGIKFEF